MKFAVATVDFWISVGLDPTNWRKSLDGKKAICHVTYAEKKGINLYATPGVDIYDSVDTDFESLLRAPEWTERAETGDPDSFSLLNELNRFETKINTAVSQKTTETTNLLSPKIEANKQDLLAAKTQLEQKTEKNKQDIAKTDTKLEGYITTNDKDKLSLTAQLQHITDDGYLIADMIGLKKYNSEEEARLNVDNDNNAELLQGFLNSGHKIKLNSGYYAFEKELIWGYGNLIKGSNKAISHMIFPNSRGIVFGKIGWFGHLQICDLSITSLSHCIDFKNESGTERPHNVFQNDFSNLLLNSEEGHCVYAGNNRGQGGDALVFEQVFSHIRVTAPNGSGFYGIGGLGIRFEYINDAVAIKNVFENCHGQFSNVNTSFAAAEYFLFFGSDAPANYAVTLDFYNVNMEDVVKAGIRIESSQISISRLSMNRTTYSPPKAQTEQKTEPPFYFPDIQRFEMVDSGASSYPSRYDTDIVKAPFYVFVKGTSINVVSDKPVDIYSGMYKSVITWNPTGGFANSPYANKFGKERHLIHEELHANTLVGARVRKVREVTDGSYNFATEQVYDEFRYVIENPLTLPYVGAVNSVGSGIIRVSNASTSTADLTLQHSTMMLHNGVNKVLSPGESIMLMYANGKWSQIITADML